MDPIRPIGPELPAIQPVWREGERQKKEQTGRERQSRERDPESDTSEEDDGRPHIDVTV